MIEVRPFRPFHVDLLRAQGVQHAQLAEVSLVPATYASIGPPSGPAVTAFAGTRVLLCGGIQRLLPGSGVCWALMAEDTSAHMRWLHYAVKRFLELERWRRLEATVEDGFEAGCRWVRLLGFTDEGAMPGYGVNGETHRRYARVRL